MIVALILHYITILSLHYFKCCFFIIVMIPCFHALIIHYINALVPQVYAFERYEMAEIQQYTCITIKPIFDISLHTDMKILYEQTLAKD